MNLFSKLFSFTPKTNHARSHENTLSYLRELYEQSAEFYTRLPLFHHKQTQNIELMMLHPSAGIVLFNFFDYHFHNLQKMTVSVAKEEDKHPEIKTKEIKKFIELRLDERFHAKVIPLRSILICTHLSESEFDNLDESFHTLIPKSSALFTDSNSEAYHKCILSHSDTAETYDIDAIKQALFAEFVLPEENALMSKAQQAVLHAKLEKKSLLKGLPGSGKSSLLIAKALYEKMKEPQLRLIIFAKHTCNVHQLQSMIFTFLENAHWGLNPADIDVSNFDSLQKRLNDKEKYDLIVCDDINPEDSHIFENLLSKNGTLLASSSHAINNFGLFTLPNESFRLSPALCAACEGFKVEKLSDSLSLQNDTSAKNILRIIEKLLKSVSSDKITIFHYSKEEALKLQTAINTAFNTMSYMHDDIDKKEGILFYPLRQMGCITNEYILVIVDDLYSYDATELISRATHKSYILCDDKEVYQLINLIKGNINESY